VTSETASTFELARREERGLNARQREILGLIERGHTNREIADEFGMTLDGAKWNVSEILTKLGLATREEAAEYWRWRRGSPARQFVRRLGGLARMPAVRWVGVGAGVAAVGVVVVLALSQGDDSARSGVPPFYLEATVSFVDNSESIGTNIAGAAPPPSAVERREETLRWWSRDRDHARFEVETTSPAIDSGTKTIVVDGTNQWVFGDTTNSYEKSPMAEVPAEIKVRPFTLGIFDGPWPLPATTIEEVLGQVRGFSQGEGHAAIVGHETILGRDTTIIEFGPTASRGSNAGATPNGRSAIPGAPPAPPAMEHYGTGRIYLDVERMFILGYETEGDGQEIQVRVTKLVYDTDVPDDRVRFKPPAGAIEVQRDGSSSSGSGSSALGGGPGGLIVPTGFFRPAYVPAGYEVSRTASDGPGAEAPSFDLTLQDADGHRLGIQQRMRQNGLPASLTKGEKTTVHGSTAYFATDSGTTTLAWFERGLAVLVTSDSVSRAELLRVAEGLVAN
jgi:DNA-binding CsgD family transcriptional regulator